MRHEIADARGWPAYGVLNSKGREVAQTAQGVGRSFGDNVRAVQGSGVRVITATLAAEHPTPAMEQRLEIGDSYAVPAFGSQAGA